MDAEPSERFPALKGGEGTKGSARPFLLVAGLSAGLAVLAALYLFDPATGNYYPACPVHQLTGLQCPGCGGLRAMHQLMHGNFGLAWGLNPLVFFLWPLVLWFVWRKDAMANLRPVHGWVAGVVLVLFGVWRNLR